jgi:RimJ/RimL family protein N-acetyltransferase
LAAPAEPAPHLIVTGERVAFGPLREDLIPVYANWLTTLEVACGVGNTVIYTVEAESTWYEEAAKPDPGQALFTIYDRFDLVPIGTTGLTNIDHRHGTATFGIMLGERRGQGLGTEATRLMLDWAFTVLGLHNVDLLVFAWNRPAIRCYEKAGFRQIGRRRGGAVCMGRRFDVVIMDAIAEEFTGSVLADLVPE